MLDTTISPRMDPAMEALQRLYSYTLSQLHATEIRVIHLERELENLKQQKEGVVSNE